MNSQIIDKKDILPGLQNMSRVVIELGCGNHKKDKSSIGIDFIDNEHIDIIADINKGLGFLPDNSVDIIYSSHFLEHLGDLGYIMTEIYRVLKKGGKNIGLVPHFSNPYYYSDFTHKTPFGLYTFSYFTSEQPFKRKVPAHYNDIHFKINKIRIIFYSPFKMINIFRKCYTVIFNSSRFMKEFYEGCMSPFLPAHEIEFELEKPDNDQNE
jgi:SAM-dependent methyltransferase